VILEGRVAWIYGDDFDVDEIVGLENIRTFDVPFLKGVCMTAFEEGFVDQVLPGDVLVGGRNFGYGHPHDQAMLIMRALGIAGVLADSFAPLFARTETFNGFPLLACPGIAAAVRRWDRVRVDWEAADVSVPRPGHLLKGVPPSPDAVELVRNGGGRNLLLSRLNHPRVG
jgi:3-isopropylmalate/(R)-2-methylmalate dehydratase small subunit